MTKLLFAMLSSAFVFALATGASAPTPAQAAPTSVKEPLQDGRCKYYCGANPTPFRTNAACQAVCAELCEPIC